MQKGWVAKCDASPLGLFSFQSAKQTSTFFEKPTPMPIDRGMREDEKKKL